MATHATLSMRPPAATLMRPHPGPTRMPAKATKKAKPKGATRASGTKKPAKKSAPSKARAGDAKRDWQEATLEHARRLIRQADPHIVEERKWKKPTNPAGVPVWTHDGIVCTGETYKDAVKLTFARGATLPDPHKLFNASLDGGTRRAIDIRQGGTLRADAFKALIRAAVEANAARATAKKPRASARKAAAAPEKKVPLLAGGNPQIPKGDGDAPVQAYIRAMPGWKRSIGERIDAIVAREVPHVKKAVKWNSPFYGVDGQGWFLSTHVFANYVKATFFNGAALRPTPPGGTAKSKDARWVDIREGDLDETQLAAWVRQAAALPGWRTDG